MSDLIIDLERKWTESGAEDDFVVFASAMNKMMAWIGPWAKLQTRLFEVGDDGLFLDLYGAAKGYIRDVILDAGSLRPFLMTEFPLTRELKSGERRPISKKDTKDLQEMGRILEAYGLWLGMTVRELDALLGVMPNERQQRNLKALYRRPREDHLRIIVKNEVIRANLVFLGVISLFDLAKVFMIPDAGSSPMVAHDFFLNVNNEAEERMFLTSRIVDRYGIRAGITMNELALIESMAQSLGRGH